MFAAWKYRDAVAQLDTGLFNQTAASAASTSVSVKTSGSPLLMFGSNNFHKVTYRCYVASGASQNVILNVYYWAASSISTSSGSGAMSKTPISSLWSTSAYSSVTSYWSVADSANFTASAGSAGTNSVSNTVIQVDFRPEKFSTGWNVLLPVVTCTGAASQTQAFTVTGDAYFTDYNPANNFDDATLYVVETDYF